MKHVPSKCGLGKSVSKIISLLLSCNPTSSNHQTLAAMIQIHYDEVFFSKSWYWSFEKWSQCKSFLCFLSHFANSDLPMKIDVFWFKCHQKLFQGLNQQQSAIGVQHQWAIIWANGGPIPAILKRDCLLCCDHDKKRYFNNKREICWWKHWQTRYWPHNKRVVNMRYVIMAEECPWKQGCADIKHLGYVLLISRIL